MRNTRKLSSKPSGKKEKKPSHPSFLKYPATSSK